VAEVDVFFDSLATLLLPVLPYFLWRPLWRDPDDTMMLDAAVNRQADVMATFNIHDVLSGEMLLPEPC